MKTLGQEIQEENLDILARNGGLQFIDTFFPYTSGRIGPFYVQCGAITKNPQDYRTACMAMKHLFVNSGAKCDVVSGGESTDWIFSLMVAYQLGKPHSMIYKSGKVVGADFKEKKAVHFSDTNNQGFSIGNLWVPTIRKNGGEIKEAFFYVDRMEEGVKVVEDLKLNSNVVVPLDEHAWDYLLNNNVINNNIHESLRKRLEDKDQWAIKMLRSGPGIERLTGLLINYQTREKAKKILTHGYPKMAVELRGRLIHRGLNPSWLPN